MTQIEKYFSLQSSPHAILFTRNSTFYNATVEMFIKFDFNGIEFKRFYNKWFWRKKSEKIISKFRSVYPEIPSQESLCENQFVLYINIRRVRDFRMKIYLIWIWDIVTIYLFWNTLLSYLIWNYILLGCDDIIRMIQHRINTEYTNNLTYWKLCVNH